MGRARRCLFAAAGSGGFRGQEAAAQRSRTQRVLPASQTRISLFCAAVVVSVQDSFQISFGSSRKRLRW